jgi:hypothetical protein
LERRQLGAARASDVVGSNAGGRMDPVTLAAAAVALLKPFLARSSDEFAGQAGNAAWRLAERLFDRLRGAATESRSARASLRDLQRAPERSQAAEEAICHALERDPALAEEVGAIIAQVKKLGPTVVVTQRIKEAEDAVGVKAGRLRAGSVDVSQDVEKADRVTGAEFDEIG